MRRSLIVALALVVWGAMALPAASEDLRGTGDLGLIVERASGSVLVIETTGHSVLGRIEGLGDLSHASVVYSRDGRYGYVFGRDGGLTKVDLLTRRIVKRIVQAGNSIGGAISQDGSLVAVSNYEPGGIKVFDAGSLELVANIPALGPGGAASKTVGLVDAPGGRFVYALYDSGEIWVVDPGNPDDPILAKFEGIGDQPYDGLITPDGRYYIAGLFGEDGVVLLDLWDLAAGPRRILDGYGRGEAPLPVYKMPHLEGWASAGDVLFLPAVGRHELLIVERGSWREVGRIPVHGQPIFAVARPDGRQVWVNFALPDNDVVQVIDVPSRSIVRSLELGPGVLHLEFTPRGEQVWISVRDEDRVDVYDTETLTRLATIPANKPSGIFLTARAGRTGL
ncbi:MAG: protein nirF [Rhodospirillaceae bacterium]|jgi:protein NirF|nr:protein nirF [Rhodospirillaceae bacterium]MBT6117676.1 protein nirF [Rhodospirillaceae bacterium]